MRSFVQILTTPTADTPGTTLILHFDNKRYLIGSLAEGTQRACVQMGARLLKVSECFLTGRTEWTNTGGMIGMILTLADSSASSAASSLEDAMRKAQSKAKRMGVLDNPEKMQELEDQAKKEATNSLTIFGPPNLNHTLATARRFVFRKGMPINIHEIRDNGLPEQKPENDEWTPFWADQNVKVWSMSVQPAADKAQARSSSISPLKRSFDEMRAGDEGNVVQINGDLAQEDRDYLTVKAVVGEMFNSSWRLDTLYETALSQVKLPATIFVRDPETNKIQKYTGPLPNDPKNPPPNPNLTVLVRKPWPGALVNSLPETKPAKEAISYIFRNHMQRGKFRPEKAKARGIKPGIDFSKLTKGESVQNDKGETVTPEEVMDPSRVGGGIAVIDLPGPDYIDNLIARPEWREQKVMEGVGAVMWLCGKAVATDARIHAFMKEFSHLEHIVSSPDYCPNNIALDSVAASTIRLKKVDPARYVVPVHDVEGESPQQYGGSADAHEQSKKTPLPDKVHVASRGQSIQLEPAIEFQNKDVIPLLNIDAAAAEIPEEVMQEASKAQQAASSPDAEAAKWLQTLPPGAEKAEVITLGTGSALPSKYRNVSSTLVRVPGWGNILLDAGENTLGQLKRVFSPAELKAILHGLRMLVISHMHADHQLGTTSIIKEWYEEVHASKPAERISQSAEWDEILAPRDRLAVLSEPAMQHWLYEYSFVEDYGYSRLAPLSLHTADVRKGISSRLGWFIPPSQLSALSQQDYQNKLDDHVVPLSALNLKDLQAVGVKHCHGARAVSITTPSGFKVSYSGDCRPSEAFAQIGKGSTVCIHEATFDDELQGDAEAKNHSTTSEALDIAQKMNARACVLTHFSQRYQKVPVLERGEDGPKDVLDTNSSADALMVDESTNPEDEMSGPLEDVAATFPDQQASNGGGGKQYDIPSKFGTSKPEAVKFKLQSDMKVAVAFDYMRVRVGDIWQMEKFTPALLKLFEEEAKEVAEAGDGGSNVAVKGQQGHKGKDKQKGKSQRRN
ncbi:Putative metallo-beta-lactamase, tRNase Z endonuclease [Septoria linicola]|uniref:ribonuclease Z n=1 Tax=Septoria linicola TaxID=215465 RepID=A0A9Q9AUQ0_9PEZI|nr:putative metallo-beta-lactamase, tRNase Z endonuclease [Septoria linicola]USW53543.1 Putative metallo-beta-lactamase, tRNase Z endonuclease [Septoria linicola]